MGERGPHSIERDQERRALRRRVSELETQLLEMRRRLGDAEAPGWELSGVSQSTHDILYRLDRAGRLCFVSPQVRRYGHDPDALLGRPFTDLVVPEDRERMAGTFARAIETGTESLDEFRIRDADGGVHWFEDRGRIQFDPAGEAVGVIGALRDITARKQAEAALRASEEKYRTLVNSAGEAIVTVDYAGHYLFCNPVAGAHLGERPERVVGRTLWDLFPWDYADRQMRQIREVIRSGRPGLFEIATPIRGAQRWYRASIVGVQEGGAAGAALIVARDITDAKEAEESLRTSEARFRSVLDVSRDVIYKFDVRRFCLEYCSPAIRDLTGYTAEEISSMGQQGLLEHLHPDDRADSGQRLTGLYEGRQDVVLVPRVEYRWRHRDGTWRWLSDSRVLLRDEEGRPLAVVGSIRDVTEAKQVEQELRASEQRFRALFENAPVPMWFEDLSAVEAHVEALRRAGHKNLRSYWAAHPEDLRRCARKVRVRDVNRASLGLFGAARKEELLGSLEGVLTDESLQAFAEQVAVLAEGRHTCSVQSVNRTLAGELRNVVVSWTRLPTPQRGWEEILVCTSDVTQRQRAEAAIQEARDRLQYVVDNTWDILFEIDLEGNYTFGNKAAERITGYALDELLRMNMRELLAPAYRHVAFTRLGDRLAGRGDLSQPFELEIVAKDGRRVAIELTTTPAYRDGRLVAIQGIARDITRRREAERAARGAHLKLVTAREEERRSLARDIHDSIGQSTIAVHFALKALTDDIAGALPPEQARRLRRLGEDCGALIREVRHISHGLFPPTLESLGLPAALRSLAHSHQASAPAVRFTAGADLEEARFNRDVEIILFRIAQEAVTNALRHSGARRIELGLRRKAGGLDLTVADDGDGFDPAAAENGLGMTTMRERVHAVGGELDVRAGKGGTRLRAYVPAASLRQGATETDPAGAS